MGYKIAANLVILINSSPENSLRNKDVIFNAFETKGHCYISETQLSIVPHSPLHAPIWPAGTLSARGLMTSDQTCPPG